MTEVIEKTENKKGYKKTKLGWIPEDWVFCSILDLVNWQILEQPMDGNHGELHPTANDYVDNGIPFVMANNIVNNRLNLDDCHYITKEFANNLHKGFSITNDILFTHKGSIGNVAFVKNIKTDFIILTPQVTYYRVINDKKLSRYYLFIFLQYKKFLDYIQKLCKGGTRDYIGILKQLDLPFILPPIQEQEKIAEILSAWDDGIETLEKLIEQKEILKKATMQKLFLEKESWKMMRFDKIFKDFCKKNCPRERLLSATQENGVIPRDMLSGKVMSPEGSLDGYKLIEAGDFVISLRSFQGGLEYSKYRGILSPAYTVLKNIIDIDKDFYRHFFKSYKFIEKYLSISVIGIRDGKQISYSDLSSVKIPYPPLEEQEKIGKILNCYDEEIQLLNSKLEKLKEQKKGLMQKLLTGQIRVKV